MQQIVQSETGRLMGWRALAIWTAATILESRSSTSFRR